MDGEHESIGERILREHAESLTVGTRVRVRLSGECSPGRWHGTIEDGVTGFLFSRDAINQGAPPDHDYHVWFDRPLRGRQMWSYCAAELTPIPWPTPEEIVARVQAELAEDDA